MPNPIYYGWSDEDPEMDAMRCDQAELLAEQPAGLFMNPCEELAKHGSDCWRIETENGQIVTPHIPYAEAYKQVYGTEPPPFDPFFEGEE